MMILTVVNTILIILLILHVFEIINVSDLFLKKFEKRIDDEPTTTPEIASTSIQNLEKNDVALEDLEEAFTDEIEEEVEVDVEADDDDLTEYLKKHH